jgi:hypothetical protein
MGKLSQSDGGKLAKLIFRFPFSGLNHFTRRIPAESGVKEKPSPWGEGWVRESVPITGLNMGAESSLAKLLRDTKRKR